MGRRSGKRRHRDPQLRVIHGDGQSKRGTAVVGDALQPLMVDLRRALRADHPWPLLEWVSAMVVASQSPRDDGAEPLGLAPLVESFIGVDLAETTAALSVLAVLLDDAEMVADIDQELAHRTQPMPLWLRGLRETRVLDARLMEMPDDRGQDLLLGLDWSGGGTGTYVVYVDHGRGTVVRDAFPTPVGIDVVVGQLRSIDDPIARGFGFDIEQLELADARALVGEALDATIEAHHDPESETWPAGRPILEWLLRTMPAGGIGWATRERVAPFHDEDGDQAYDLAMDDMHDSDDPVERFVDALLAPMEHLVDEFAESDVARSAGVDVLDDATDRAALAMVCSSGHRQSEKAMLTWTPDRVEDLLLGTLPRAYLVGDRVARRVPTMVSAFAEWSAARTGARDDHVARVTDAVERYRADYLALVTSPEATRLRLAVQDYADLLGDSFGMVPVIDPRHDWSEIVLDHLADLVGGRDALHALDPEPLPAEDLDWTGVPQDIHEPVAEVLRLLDRLAGEHFDVELRTAQRRFLSAVVAGDPAIFRRRGSTASAAAVIAWLVGRANGVIACGGKSMPAGDLWPYFGLQSGASSRGPMFRRAAGLDAYSTAAGLGRPEWLVSAARAQIAERRDMALNHRLF